VLLAGSAGDVAAQEERLVATEGAWSVKCGAPPGAKNEKCWVEQKVTAEDRPQVGLTIVYFQSADNKTRRLQAVAPLGVLLLNGLGLKIDGADVGRVPFQRCPPLGCIAEAQVDDKLLNQFKSGGEALFIIFDTPEAGIGIPVSLAGFADAIAALEKAQPQAQ
jgi:invasion protein IalB